MQTPAIQRIVAVALNPAIDRVLEVPHLTIGAHQHARLLVRTASGKAVNVARNLSILEVPSILAGLVGREDQELYTRGLQGTQVQMRMLPVAGRTRENITLLDPATRVETHLRDRGFEVAPAELAALMDHLGRLAGPGTLFVFSGSLPPGISPAQQAEMVQICRAAGALVAVDASGPALPAAGAAGPWLIKPNRLELEELLGTPLPQTADLLAAGRQLAASIPLVLVSSGSEGAYLFAGQEAWHGRCAVGPERIISTVGCGDALLAGFVASLFRRATLAESLRLGLAAAAAATTNLSATFTREGFEEFQPLAEASSVVI